MATLSEQERFDTWAAAMRGKLGATSLTKAELRAAVDAADDWADANVAAFNAALPQPARSTLTSKQKAIVLMLVISKRYEVTP